MNFSGKVMLVFALSFSSARYAAAGAAHLEPERAQSIRQDTTSANRPDDLIGTWRDENSRMTFAKDGSFTTKWDSGQESSGDWSVIRNRLHLITLKANYGDGWRVVRLEHVEELISLKNDIYQTRDPNGKIWIAKKVIDVVGNNSVPLLRRNETERARLATMNVPALNAYRESLRDSATAEEGREQAVTPSPSFVKSRFVIHSDPLLWSSQDLVDRR